MDNLVRNEQFDKSKNLKPIPFSKENQPTAEQKKKGWERKREAQRMLECFSSYLGKSYADILHIKSDIKKNPQDYTLLEVKLIQYMDSEKMTVDLLDRFIGKARIKEIDDVDNEDLQIVIIDHITSSDGTVEKRIVSDKTYKNGNEVVK